MYVYIRVVYNTLQLLAVKMRTKKKMYISAQSKFALDQLGDSGARLQMTVI